MKAPNQRTEMRVGDCPACSTSLWATLDVALSISTPDVSKPGDIQLDVTPSIVGMTIDHSCGSRPDLLPSAAPFAVAT